MKEAKDGSFSREARSRFDSDRAGSQQAQGPSQTLGHEMPTNRHLSPRIQAMIIAWQSLPETGFLDLAGCSIGAGDARKARETELDARQPVCSCPSKIAKGCRSS
jgi:hypothetical protein